MTAAELYELVRPLIGTDCEPEEWRSLTGYDSYEVSNRGRLRTLKRHRNGEPCIIKTYLSWKGYVRFPVRTGGLNKCVAAQRAVLMAFARMPTPGEQADHIDGDRTNNHLSNLRWVTATENNRDRLRRHGGAPWRRGARNPMTTLNDVQVRVIRRCEERGCQVGWKQLLATSWGVSRQSVSDIARGKRWSFDHPTRLHALVAAAVKVLNV
jgi:hypothetical protein